ncbi:hypothetical protein K8Z49_46960 [Actinomadura madurae]|uniref:hypothetical protein n=1 Tax=Actinomadura madurae TaxID=1993 RepID=UPI000D896929|nr:hypothetical protein [Actinomadura madurae]SPT63622.1 Uncharacterised protein [Actinomadura madurae]
MPPWTDLEGELREHGYCGTVSMWRNRTPFRRKFPELVDALFAREDAAPALVVYVDARTSHGGSQYLDSPAIGDYHTYLCEDVVAWVDVPFDPVTGRPVPGGVGPMAMEWLTGRLTGEDR